MDELYPAGPTRVPADLTRPSPAYRRHAYLAVAGVVLFVVAYLALAGWFAWTAFRLFAALRHAPDQAVMLVAGGAAAAFLAVFMVKAVIFVRRGGHDDVQLEVTAAAHPRLFAFLHRLADEAGAPRPHRVFLSPRVNAAVFYDLSLANLVLPSKKNLEIGLGLINVLTLAELKAVLAHEFGHFAQRTMAVGRWVYIAQQIAGHIVVKRDALDRMLQWISTIDLRVAWIGWILRAVVWSIRSLVDTLFGWVVLAQRALSREMELQADLVAVSLTGSDALIHALHRLDAADDAMDRALAFTGGEQRGGRAVADVFAVQRRMLERKRAILDDPSYGEVPPLPAAPAAHRLFRAQLAHPPRMWATHPPSELREHNAKRVYVAAPLDDRSGWLLFDDPAAVRAQVTARLYADAAKPAQATPLAATLATLDAAFDRRSLDPTYRGAYLGRSVARAAATVDELFGPPPATAELGAALEALYPPSLSADLERVRELTEEKAILEALRRGILEAPGKVVRFRGQDVKRKELPRLIVAVDAELAAARRVVTAHDREVRAVHLAAAATLSPAWAAYLRALVAVIHYADHAEADLDDAAGHLGNVFAVVTADRKVTNAEIDRLVTAATDVHAALSAVHDAAADVGLGDALATRLELTSWAEGLGALTLPAPYPGIIGEWLDAAQSWIDSATRALSALSGAALEELLHAEEQVALAVKAGQAAADPPAPPRVPARYRVLTPAQERPRQLRLGWWDRFQIADGWVPGAARFAVAGLIVGGVVLAGRAIASDATVHVYNGLARPVEVDIGGTHVAVPGHGHAEVEVETGTYAVRARTTDGRVIETFTASADDDFGRYVYNVAQAAPLVEAEFRADGGDAAPRLSVARWAATDADRVYGAMPTRVEARDSVASVSVLASLAGEPPSRMVDRFAGAERDALILAHATWEPAEAHDLATWMALVPPARAAEVIAARLAADADDLLARRLEQDRGGAEVCARHAARAAEVPADARWQYLAARCLPPAARDQAFAALADRFPDEPWARYAAAVAFEHAGRWAEAAAALDRVHVALPAMREAIVVRLARMRRVLAESGATPLADLVRESPRLAMLTELETGPRPDGGGLVPYWYLAHGQAEAAAAAAAVDDRASQVLAAASDGAPPALATAALAVPVEQLGPELAVLGFALAVRAGQDPAPYLAAVAQLADDGPQVHAFLDALRADRARTVGDAGVADALLRGTGLEARGLALAAAAVVLGPDCPPAWRELARRALFVGERPFLQPAS